MVQCRTHKLKNSDSISDIRKFYNIYFEKNKANNPLIIKKT